MHSKTRVDFRLNGNSSGGLRYLFSTNNNEKKNDTIIHSCQETTILMNREKKTILRCITHVKNSITNIGYQVIRIKPFERVE